jgi:hypothetical protein
MAVVLAVSLTAALCAQDGAAHLRDGTLIPGRLTGVEMGSSPKVSLTDGRRIPWSQLLAWHGPISGAGSDARAAVFLVGGDRIEGEIQGGDEGGDKLSVRSTSLGTLEVRVDRLQSIWFRRRAPELDWRDLRIEETQPRDEALFLRTARGLDLLLGAIHRFTPRGVQFEWTEGQQPKLFDYDQLAGIAVRGGDRPPRSRGVQIVTRAGDVLVVDLLGTEQGKLACEWETDQKLGIPLADILSVTRLGAGAVFLSDLEPERAEERDRFPVAEATDLPVAFPYRKDRGVTGALLSGGGLCHGKGLGVHSYSALTYRVPEGCTKLHALVAVGETGQEVCGEVDLRVRAGDQTLFHADRLRGGQAPVSLGLLSVKPGSLVTLEVDFGRGLQIGDRVHWLSAVFLP